MGKTSNAVKDRWNRANYDDLRVRLPKGSKVIIDQAARAVGESVNAYTNHALLDRMGVSSWDEVKDTNEPQPPD